MTRLIWSAVTSLVLIAIGAPCLTFYILIKEYWAEVDALRHELLLCRFGAAKESSRAKSSFFEQVPRSTLSAEDYLDNGNFPSLPVPQRRFERDESEKISSITERSAPLSEYIASLSSAQSDASDMEEATDPSEKNSSQNSPPSNSDSVRISREIPDPNSTNILVSGDRNFKTTSAANGKQKDCSKIKKQVLDLSARISACRKCLTMEKQKEPECGVGSSWRDFRKKERKLRRELRKEKRRRRKKEKKSPIVASSATSSEDEAGGRPLADISPIYSYRLENNEPLDNQQMRENRRVSTDFRRSFNQKILRMDESLMQFTETQSSFCKELRDNLGSSLEKRGQELEALSEQIASLVRTTTAQVTMIEKLTSDQVHAGQTNIEKNLGNLQILRENQVRSFKTFHKKIFLPAMVTLTSLLGEQASSVTNMGVDLITKVEMLQDFFLTFSTGQGDMLIKLSEEVNMFTSKHGNQIMRSRDHAKRLHLNTQNFIRELQTRMNNVVKELVLIRLQSQTFVSLNENTFHEISASLNKTEDVVATLSGDLQRRVEKAKTDIGDLKEGFRQDTDLISSRIETGVSEVLMRNHAGITQIGEVELDTRAFSKNGEAAWNEMYVNQETELRQEADMLANNLRSQTHHTQNILGGLRGTASTHEQVLEQQRMDFQGFVRKRQESLDTQCSSISDWAFLMSSELRKRDEDLHRFLSEELRVSPFKISSIGGGA